MTQIFEKKRSFWSFLTLTVSFCVVLAVGLELLAHTPWLEKLSPYRSVDNFDYQFEIKWFRLQDYVKSHGGVDIIFLGSSLVNTGVDPNVVTQTYYQQTGIQPRIFNFGVEGMTIAPNSVIARLLVESYHPALLVYVTEMRDFIGGLGLEYETPFLKDPWLQYKSGNFNQFGWMLDHSAALQHYLPFRNWARSDFPQTIAFYIKRYHDTSSSGYEPDEGIGVNINIPPNPNDPAELQNFKDYGNYQIAASRVDDLSNILDFSKNQGTAVWVVEMPVHPTFYVYVGGETVHMQFQETISSVVTTNGGSFLPSEACLGTIPLKGRSNRWHLNYIGAPYFSSCLGDQLAIFVEQSHINPIKASATR
ncbi:MAG: hypothetical protein ABSA01_13685 [Anaerolineales bacterium]|jgi:hypothetical protein